MRTNKIEEIIQGNKFNDGGHAYSLDSNICRINPDDSVLNQVIYRSNRGNYATEEQVEKEDAVIQAVLKLSPSDIIEDGEGYSEIIKGLWQNKYGDQLQVLYSDHFIYIQQFLLGQH